MAAQPFQRIAGIFLIFLSTTVSAQEPEKTAQPVVIKRQPLRLIPPSDYQMTFSLQPIRTVELKAPIAGVVRSVALSTGDKPLSQSPAVQLENTALTIERDKARLALRVAELEQKASGGDADIAQARVDIARKELELADWNLKQALVHTPFDCVIFRIQAVPGQYMAAGDSLMTVADLSRFQVEIPVDRKTAQVSQSITLRVEGQTVSGKIQSILPLAERFEKLRELIPTAASAVVVIDNSGNSLQAGQSVFADIIPRDAVCEVPNTALQNIEGDHPPGHRQVQVVRDFTIRNVSVRLLGTVGNTRTFVTGEFHEGDDLVTSSTVPLKDGTQVRPTTASPKTPKTSGSPGNSGIRPPVKGF